ncbi:bacillithiol biosynthesis cysteine-adding enzyme BshC [Salinicoccus sp. YB14-2]|uniref:bacillithiol biosynthesis cysteine-adding enzyme BshC n=1 Tax=Salinicoccus sp. YB14-2 TaxID=1572701 RepID=UPI00068D48F3|nr:bacillithiol biosynthesis cysteine-adding enzyme BshC [Salinicoccus sp. YB14-2]
MEIECMKFSKDKFIDKFNQQEEDVLKFYQNLSLNEKSISQVLERPVHDHTKALAEIIKNDMQIYGLSDAQKRNLELLSDGNRVVIGGQQAGLFMSPSYIIHKIMSIVIVTKDMKEKYDYDAVPVFWVAGEDHDYEEINHTFVYDDMHRKKKKISYKPNLKVNMSVGFYEYDKQAMKDTLDKIMEMCGDRADLKALKIKVIEFIDEYTYWTELFHALVHDVFKDEGVLIFNSHTPEVRQFEKSMFKTMIESHEKIDDAFVSGQKQLVDVLDISPTIFTENNVHLFINAPTVRTLLEKDGENFKAEDDEYSKDELLELLESSPELFSNNVVTRPLMQEMLFNTLIFLGGNAEVKYWGELHKVFEVMDVDMPIILKRIEFEYLSPRLEKLMKKHELDFNPQFYDTVDELKKTMVADDVNSDFINKIDEITKSAENSYKALHDINSQDFMTDIVEANFKHHLKQLDYLERRYKTEVKRHRRKELGDLTELQEKLLPDGGLHERMYHPWQYMTVFREFPPLSYTTELVIIKTP